MEVPTFDVTLPQIFVGNAEMLSFWMENHRTFVGGVSSLHVSTVAVEVYRGRGIGGLVVWMEVGRGFWHEILPHLRRWHVPELKVSWVLQSMDGWQAFWG